MPSRIKFETAMDALYSVVQDHGTIRLTKAEFFDVMRGHGVASSKEALRTLWAQARFSPWNIYTGPCSDLIIVNVPVLARQLVNEEGYTYTHIHTAQGVE